MMIVKLFLKNDKDERVLIMQSYDIIEMSNNYVDNQLITTYLFSI